jgi:signal transduction histidine kinase
MLFVAAAPIGLAGFQALGLSRAALEESIRETLAKTSTAEAEIISRDLADTERSLLLLASALRIDPDSLTSLSKDLARVYLLSDRFNTAALFDQTGKQIGPTLYVDDRASFSDEYQSHQELDEAELKTFLQMVAQTGAVVAGCSLDQVYQSKRKRTALAVCSVPVNDTHGRTLRLAIELSLQGTQKRFEILKVGRGGSALLVDGAGRLVFHPQIERALAREDVSQLPILHDRLGSLEPAVTEYQDPERGPMLGAWAPVPGSSWSLVVAQPSAEAFEPVEALGLRLAIWLLAGLALAAGLGLLLSKRIVRPVQDLVTGALAIASGDLDHKIKVRGRDEIGKLGETFNHMATELSSHQQHILAQSEEIQRWNVELQKRVDNRTRELKQIQDQLIQARKMAAMGELGAGVAHEINNPLMGVIGCAQLLLMRHPEGDPDRPLLADVEREGQRIKAIVDSLLRNSQQPDEHMAKVDLASLARQVAEEMKAGLSEHRVQLVLELPETLPGIQGSRSDLKDCITELVRNASHAMPQGGTIRLKASGTEGEVVRLEVSDTGCGIPAELHERIFEPFFTTKQNWDGKGLGLSNVFQTVQRHQARIDLTSQEGQGSRFVLTFPALRSATHLR